MVVVVLVLIYSPISPKRMLAVDSWIQEKSYHITRNLFFFVLPYFLNSSASKTLSAQIPAEEMRRKKIQLPKRSICCSFIYKKKRNTEKSKPEENSFYEWLCQLGFYAADILFHSPHQSILFLCNKNKHQEWMDVLILLSYFFFALLPAFISSTLLCSSSRLNAKGIA